VRVIDMSRLAAGAVIAHRGRSLLTSLGIAVGIAAVVLLTSIGEGVHRFVLQEFSQFGSNIIAVTPGKTETFGISGAQISNVRPLSLDDSAALGRPRRAVFFRRTTSERRAPSSFSVQRSAASCSAIATRSVNA
jgi:putative ABC transport system permease protein